MSGQHVEGRAISASTYTNWACRCDGCSDAHRIEKNRQRAENPNTYRRSSFRHVAAWAWVRANRPDIAEQIKSEAVRRYPSIYDGASS